MRTANALTCWAILSICCTKAESAETYPIVDTGQERCYENWREIEYPARGAAFHGQDAQHTGNSPKYRDNGDGTVSDLVTGLMWLQDPGAKKTHSQAVSGAATCRAGAHSDWRLPSIKELYSLILFSGEDIDPNATDTSKLKPFIDTKYFRFQYGDPRKGERAIDSQFATSTLYVSTTMHGNKTMFGVNFADGRIKGYPVDRGRRGIPTYYVLYVRGNTRYGRNNFVDNADGTVTDRATGLMWAKVDSGHLEAGAKRDGKLNWEEALRWVEGLNHAGHSDWRLPNAKELQSIVDYKRSPDTTGSAAIDPIFDVTTIRDGKGKPNHPFYWTSTTHKRLGAGEAAAYVAFGRSQGWMQSRFGGGRDLLDVHGAGSQRSDPKSGDPSRFPYGRGPQGDVIAIYNMVRPVRGGVAAPRLSGPKLLPAVSRRGPGGPNDMPPGGGPPPHQGGDTQRNGADFVRRLDRNGDGRVSRNEFRGPPRAFDRHDRNRDGYLTQDEAPMRQGRNQPPQGGGGDERRGGPQGKRDTQPPPPEAMVTPDQVRAASLRSQVRANDAWRRLPPSFVFVLADDMGWTGLSIASDDRVPESKSDFYMTPNLSKLAREGVRFSNAYAPAPMCTPTRASLLTGKSPAQLHVTSPGPPGRPDPSRRMVPPRHVNSLPTSETTIAEVLKQRGYATAHFGKWHLSGGGPGQHGFDSHDGETGNGGPGAYGDPNPKDIFGVTMRAMEFMESSVAAGKPFYVQLSHYAVHSPNEALRDTEDLLSLLPVGRNHNDISYAAMTNDLDASVGMLAKKLDVLDVGSNTYVVFMSDNGASGRPGSLENYPLSGGKASLSEGGIRVPLVITGPGIRAGSSCHTTVVGYDLFLTFCELAGLRSSPTGVEGTSIVSLLKGRDASFTRSRNEFVFHFPHYGRGPLQVPQSAIRVGNYKLIRDYESSKETLFDLSKDIGERADLAARLPEKKKTLSAQLDSYLRRVGAQLPTRNPDYDPNADTGGRPRRGQGRPQR